MDLVLSFLLFVLVYAATSLVLLRRDAVAQWKTQKPQYLGVRLAAYMAWWGIASLVPFVWHPGLLAGFIFLIVLVSIDLLLLPTDRGFWQVLGALGSVLLCILVGRFVFRQASQVQLQDALWQALYLLALVGVVPALGKTFANAGELVAKPFLSKDIDPVAKMRIGLRCLFIGHLLSLIVVVVAANRGFIRVDLLNEPIPLVLLALGLGVDFNVLLKDFNLAVRIQRSIAIVLLLMCLYVPLWHSFPSRLPPQSFPPVQSGTVIVVCVITGFLVLALGLLLRMKGGKGILILTGLGPRIKLLASRAESIEDASAKTGALAMLGGLRKAIDEVLGKLGMGDVRAAEGAEQLGADLERIEHLVATALEKQAATEVLATLETCIQLRGELQSMSAEMARPLPNDDDLPDADSLERDLRVMKEQMEAGHVAAITSNADHYNSVHSVLVGTRNDFIAITDARGICDRQLGFVGSIEALAEIAARLDLQDATVKTLLRLFDSARAAFADRAKESLTIAGLVARELVTCWKQLKQKEEMLRRVISREAHHWCSPEFPIHFYVPRHLSKNDARHIVIHVEEQSPDNAKVEIECGLVHVGREQLDLSSCPAGSIVSYDVWSTNAGRGSIQVTVSGVRSGPLRVTVLPTARDILAEAPIVLAVSAAIASVLLLAFGVPPASSGAVGAGVGAVVTVIFGLRRHFSTRKVVSPKDTSTRKQPKEGMESDK